MKTLSPETQDPTVHPSSPTLYLPLLLPRLPCFSAGSFRRRWRAQICCLPLSLVTSVVVSPPMLSNFPVGFRPRWPPPLRVYFYQVFFSGFKQIRLHASSLSGLQGWVLAVVSCWFWRSELCSVLLRSALWLLKTSLERAKDGAATMEWSRNGAKRSGNEAARGSEHGKGAATGSEHGIGSSDNAVASHEAEVSRVNERLSRLPMSEQKVVAWLTSLLDGLSIPTSSAGTNEEVKVASELKHMKVRECSSDEKDCSQRVCWLWKTPTCFTRV